MGAAQNAVGQLRTLFDPSFCVTGDYSVLLPLVNTPVFPLGDKVEFIFLGGSAGQESHWLIAVQVAGQMIFV